MIWSQALVTLADGKTLCPLEDLQIGQSLFDPLTGQPQDIIDILKRSPLAPDGNCMAKLMPYRIPADSVGPDLPRQEIWLSPAQRTLAIPPYPQGQTKRPQPAVALISASRIGTPNLPPLGRYIAIFLDTPGSLAVAGLPLAAYHLSDLGLE